MKDTNIVRAYDNAAPDSGAAERIWQRVVREADAQNATGPKARRGRPLLRRALLAAACVALTVALLTAGYAAYEKWKLPEPQPYVPDAQGGNISVHAESVYPVPTDVSDLDTAFSETEEPLSDEYFLLRAREILAQAGLEDMDGGIAKVLRQTHLYWNREEVEVGCTCGGKPVSVTFDAENGVFLGMSGIEWVLSDTAACATQAEADALAQRYYESLPVEQGYVMTACEKYDEQYWSYDFCREVEPGLYSWYECVRIAVNPVSGRLEGCRVFYVPLLDDHEPGDVPLTEEEALETVRARGFDVDSCKSVTVKKVVGKPNWMFTEHTAVHLRASEVTRLCWEVTCDNSGEFASVTTVLVDYYTGEILGGDTTG